VLQCVAVCCSVLQCVSVHNLWQRGSGVSVYLSVCLSVRLCLRLPVPLSVFVSVSVRVYVCVCVCGCRCVCACVCTLQDMSMGARVAAHGGDHT